MVNTGHGHVSPRPDGQKARCGGPGLCSECAREAAALKTMVMSNWVDAARLAQVRAGAGAMSPHADEALRLAQVCAVEGYAAGIKAIEASLRRAEMRAGTKP
jgi:hypothetical protein